jgi:hypothetical protein
MLAEETTMDVSEQFSGIQTQLAGTQEESLEQGSPSGTVRAFAKVFRPSTGSEGKHADALFR